MPGVGYIGMQVFNLVVGLGASSFLLKWTGEGGNIANAGDSALIFVGLSASHLVSTISMINTGHFRYQARVSAPTQYIYQSAKAGAGVSS
jgi:hypothetical protein